MQDWHIIKIIIKSIIINTLSMIVDQIKMLLYYYTI